jgi:hypothetical protein
VRTLICKFNTIHTQNRLIKHEINTDHPCLANALLPWLCFSYRALLSRNFIIIVSSISCPSDLTDVKYWIVIILISVH